MCTSSLVNCPSADKSGAQSSAQMEESTDILENDILALSPDVLRVLLKDHSVSHHFKSERNIFWASNDYKQLGEGYDYFDPITPERITGKHGDIIQPRAKKSREVQQQRIQEKAEVFTPAWICNKQNNLVDSAWFGRENVFNTEIDDHNGHTWQPNEEKIQFPDTKDKSWEEYVCAPRLEVACGEAPYLTSRYDAVTCDGVIPVKKRIGLLDRKLRIVGENTTTSDEWLVWAFNSLHATYGFEWQGDNLLLAREAVLYTFKEHYEEKFQQPLDTKTLENAAYIISWNLWQMDGVKCVVPLSCEWAAPMETGNLFGETTKLKCPACKKDETTGHVGIKCEVVKWRRVSTNSPKRIGTKEKVEIFSAMVNHQISKRKK